MGQWYLSKEGKAHGPLEEKKIVALIHQGQLSAMDLIYETGASEWLPISQTKEFGLYFRKESSPGASEERASEKKEWVLLKKEEGEQGTGFSQLGPFSVEDVMEHLDTGRIRFHDFAWKQGMENWVKISELKEFAQPLASSPSVDKSLYETTDAGTKLHTLVGEGKNTSLTELDSVQNFKREEDLPEEIPEDVKPQVPPRKEMEQTQVDKAPINNTGFVTASGIQEKSQSGIDLWSLEPPSKKTPVTPQLETVDETKVVDLNEEREERKGAAASKEGGRKKGKNDFFLPLDSDAWLWVAAVGTVLVSLLFFYMSLQEAPGPVPNSQVKTSVEASAAVELPAPKTRVPNEVGSLPDGKKAERIEERKKEDSLSMLKREEKKVKEAALPRDPVPPVERPVRGLASVPSKKSKTLLREQARKMSVSKKKSRKSPKAVSKKVRIQRPAGTLKARSFYRQRDRKALFYSALKAESLAADLQKNYRKWRRNKKAWAQFYSGWQKRVRQSLAPEIREFPRSAEVYAYPEFFESFKKDYKDFYEYGDYYNGQIMGLRQPSGTPRDLKKIFSVHKTKARSIGL